MSLNSMFLVKNTPSPILKITDYLLLLITFGAGFSYFIDFFPTDKTLQIGKALATLATFIALVWGFWRVHLKPSPKIAKLGSFKKNLIFVGIPTIAYFPFLALFAIFFPSLYTIGFGAEHQVQSQFEKSDRGPARRCKFNIQSDLFNNGYPAYICIDKNTYQEPSSKFILTGKQSILGVWFNSIYVAR